MKKWSLFLDSDDQSPIFLVAESRHFICFICHTPCQEDIIRPENFKEKEGLMFILDSNINYFENVRMVLKMHNVCIW